MKKIAMLTMTALTLTCFGGQPITAQAASNIKTHAFADGSKVIYAYGNGCNVQGILDKLENCYPGMVLPDCENPDENLPDTDGPETDGSGNEAPENNEPGNGMPDSNAPDNNVPDGNIPGTGTQPDNGSTEENRPENTPSGDQGDSGNQDGSENQDGSGNQDSSDTHAFIQQVVDLVNAERAKENLSPLTIDVKVQAAAQVRAKECEQLFSHTRPDGSSFATALKEQNVSYKSAGENIAWGQRSPEEVMNAWMNSSGHRANIMNANFTTIGVGYYVNANGTGYWCQLFTR